MRKKTHVGSRFESFLKKEGRLEASTALAVKRVLAWQLQQAMKDAHLTKAKLAEKLGTSRAQLDRLLDPDNSSVTLDTLARAAKAVGRRLKIELAA